MAKELFAVEDGRLTKNGQAIFSGLYLRIFSGTVSGVLCDDIQAQKALNTFLAGELEMESGRVFWKEKRVSPSYAAKLLAKQTAFVEKKSKLIETLTLEDNLFLFTDSSFFVRKTKYRQLFLSLREKLGADLPAHSRVSALTAKERIVAELMKAFAEGKRLVVLDDISEYLQKQETDEVFALLSRLRQTGMAFLVRIGFEDENIQQISRVTALRTGRTMAVLDPERQNVRAYVRRMFFDEADVKAGTAKRTSVLKIKKTETATVLSLANVSTLFLSGVSFSLKKGSLLTIHCFDDPSLLQIVGLLKGEVLPVSGDILYQNCRYRVRDVCSAARRKICFIEQSAYERMIFRNMSGVENLGIPCGEKVRNFWLLPRYEQSVVKRLEGLFGRKTLERQAKNLKSSVLQQIVYYKWLLYCPNIVVCVNPFSDVDVYMREKAMEMIRLYLERGISVLIVTSNLYTAEKFGGEVVRISKGKLLEAAPSGEHPEDRFAQSFGKT